jgi:hypothetical protein
MEMRVGFVPLPLNLGRNRPQYPFYRRLDGHLSQAGSYRKEKNLQQMAGIKHLTA